MASRRIEITAFRRRILIRCVDDVRNILDIGPVTDRVTINDANSPKQIDLNSPEGRRIVEEVIELLQDRLRNQNDKSS